MHGGGWNVRLDPFYLVAGALVAWAPGAALVWAFLPGLDWAKGIAASVILAVSVPPAAMYLLTVFFGVDLSPMNLVLVALLFTALGLAWALRPRLEQALG